jgi:phosphoribosylamine---glycine ligase
LGAGVNILIIDTEAMCLDAVLRFSAAGHSVRWWRWMKPGKPVRDGEGMDLKIVEEWQPHMLWAKDGLILVTGNFVHLHNLDRYREMGYEIFGPTAASAKLEIERSVGQEAMQAAGIDVPPFQMFDSLAEAEKFARKSDRAWVHKPTGDEEDKSLTYVARDPADLVGWLARKQKTGKPLKGKVMLQEKVEVLSELGVSGWFGPDGFIPEKFQVCIEHKNLMDGEKGPATGEMGTVCQYVDIDKLADEMLMPMEPILRALGHRGDFAVGAMIDTKGKAWPLEFTARCGYPAFYIQMASHRGDPAKWMRDLLDGKDSLKVSNDVAIGVVMAQPRWPYNASAPEQVEGNPIEGVEAAGDAVHPVAVMRGKGPVMKDGKVADAPIYQTSGEYVMVVTGLGKTIEKARKRVYASVDKIHFADRMFRTDIGCKVIEALPALHRHGYALDMEAY